MWDLLRMFPTYYCDCSPYWIYAYVAVDVVYVVGAHSEIDNLIIYSEITLPTQEKRFSSPLPPAGYFMQKGDEVGLCIFSSPLCIFYLHPSLPLHLQSACLLHSRAFFTLSPHSSRVSPSRFSLLTCYY